MNLIKDKAIDWIANCYMYITASSYTVCLSIALIALLFYVIGYRGARKVIGATLLIYYILQCGGILL